MIYDGSGGEPYRADVAIAGDLVEAVVRDTDSPVNATEVIDATGQAVSPGFVNCLSHSYYSLLQDPRGMSELLQGVTTHVFSEEPPVGPLTPAMRERFQKGLHQYGYDRVEITWSHVREYLEVLEKHGMVPNVATMVGPFCLREYGVGLEGRPATADERRTMSRAVEEAMEAGAQGDWSAMF